MLYTTFSKPKRAGGSRLIYAPHWPLLNIQRKLLELLEEVYHPSPRVMGFVKKRGIKENASMHVGKRLILNIDLQDYFPSVHFGRVRGRLLAAPYNLSNDVATTIARLCTLHGELPIGAPTSPILANMVTSPLDGELTRLAREHGCFYTRYADDITLSTNRRNFPPAIVAAAGLGGGVELGPALVEAITSNGFMINGQKTRVLTRNDRQEVCGVTVNKRLNPNRRLLREVRGALYAWHKFGRDLAEAVWAQQYNWREAGSLERCLRGKLEHIIHIKGQNDPSVALLVSRFNDLPGREMKAIEYEYTGDPRDRVVRSVCLLESGADDEMSWKQGSGFVASDGLVITNFHNIADNEKLFPKIEVIFPSRGDFRYEMEVVYSDHERDIAVIRPRDAAWRPLFVTLASPLSFSEPEVGMRIFVAGFPHYNVGDSCTVYSGEVVATTVEFGQRFFRVSQTIVKGNSGGPAFDSMGQVIGIATRGVDTHEVANVGYNGCIPLYTVDRLFLNN